MISRKNPQPLLLPLTRVAEMLDVCVRTVRRRIAAGELTAILEGGQYRIDPDDLQNYLRRRRGLRRPGKVLSKR